jgi:hypothetical protein
MTITRTRPAPALPPASLSMFDPAYVAANETGYPVHLDFADQVGIILAGEPGSGKSVGLAHVHIHDLRHTGNQFTADAGANLKELMARMGHDSPRAALIYLHSSVERQRAWLKRSARLLGLNWPSPSARRLSHLARGRHETTMTVRKTRAGERIRTADHPLTRSSVAP